MVSAREEIKQGNWDGERLGWGQDLSLTRSAALSRSDPWLRAAWEGRARWKGLGEPQLRGPEAGPAAGWEGLQEPVRGAVGFGFPLVLCEALEGFAFEN